MNIAAELVRSDEFVADDLLDVSVVCEISHCTSLDCVILLSGVTEKLY